MIPGIKNIMLRYTFIVVIMLTLAVLIIVKAGFIMFAERQYWKDVADRFIKENVTVSPTRGNIISSDGKLMASSLPEYKIYMDFRAGGYQKSDTLLTNHLTEICQGLHEIFPDKSAQEFRKHILRGRRQKSRHYLLYPKRISYIQYKQVKQLPVLCYFGRYVPGYGARGKERFGTDLRLYPEREGGCHTPPKSDEQIFEYCRPTSHRRM